MKCIVYLVCLALCLLYPVCIIRAYVKPPIDAATEPVLVPQRIPVYVVEVRPYIPPKPIQKIVTIGGITFWYSVEEPERRPRPGVPEKIKSQPKECSP